MTTTQLVVILWLQNFQKINLRETISSYSSLFKHKHIYAPSSVLIPHHLPVFFTSFVECGNAVSVVGVEFLRFSKTLLCNDLWRPGSELFANGVLYLGIFAEELPLVALVGCFQDTSEWEACTDDTLKGLTTEILLGPEESLELLEEVFGPTLAAGRWAKF